MKKEEQSRELCNYQTAQVGHGEGRRKNSKTEEDGSYHTGHVSLDQRCG